MKNIFQPAVTQAIIDRIEQLQPDAQPQWGTMNVAQMLAHCNVTYEMDMTDKHPQPNAFARFLLKIFVKNTVVGEKPYARSTRTAPQFLISDKRDFDTEKKRLIDFIKQAQQLGEAHYEGREANSFGKLTAHQWSNLFYKHLDHHLTQFGV